MDSNTDQYFILIYSSKEQKALQIFKRVWAELAAQLTKIYLEKESGGCQTTTTNVTTKNSYASDEPRYNKAQASFSVIFGKNDYSEERLWADLRRVLKTFKNDNDITEVIKDFDIAFNMVDSAEADAWIEADARGEFDNAEDIDGETDIFRELTTKSGKELLA